MASIKINPSVIIAEDDHVVQPPQLRNIAHVACWNTLSCPSGGTYYLPIAAATIRNDWQEGNCFLAIAGNHPTNQMANGIAHLVAYRRSGSSSDYALCNMLSDYSSNLSNLLKMRTRHSSDGSFQVQLYVQASTDSQQYSCSFITHHGLWYNWEYWGLERLTEWPRSGWTNVAIEAAT